MQVYSIKEKQLDEIKRKENLRILKKETELTMREKLLSQEANRYIKIQLFYQYYSNFIKFIIVKIILYYNFSLDEIFFFSNQKNLFVCTLKIII